MPRKEKTNAKTWERDRRNRMNSYFKNLADLLPPNQEGKNRNKVDILIQASKYIKDLTNRTEELFHAHAIDAHKEELNRLKKLVAQLYSRTQLLSTLLKDAGITVPAEPALEKISPLKWSNKINVEDAEKYLDRLKERKTEKRKSKSIAIKTPLKKKLKNGNNAATLSKKTTNDKESTDSIINGPAEDQENNVNSSSINNKNDDVKVSDANNKTELRSNSISASDIEISKSTGPNLRPSVRKLQSRKKVKRKVTKSRDNGSLLSKEKLRKVTRTQLQQQQHRSQSQSITSLIPGTLILSGVSKIMPLVTPMTSNIIVNGTAQSGNSIILGNTQTNPMIVMQPLMNTIQNTTVVSVQNEMATMNAVTTVQKVTLNTVPSIQTNVGLDSHDWASNVKTIIDATKIGGRKGILPKGKEITKTTMAYKVPIPAVHRDTKLNNKNTEIHNDAKKSPDVKNKMKKLKSVKNKKLNEIKNYDRELMKSTSTNTINELIDNSIVKTIEGNFGKKRKNIDGSDNNNDITINLLPDKIKEKGLPETCKSIENLRQVVEKIGDDSSDSVSIIAADKPKSLINEKYKVKATNTESSMEYENKINESILNTDVKVESIETPKSFQDKENGTKVDTLLKTKNIRSSINTSKSFQVSDTIFNNENQLINTESTDTLPPPLPASSTTTATTTIMTTTKISSVQQFSTAGKVIADTECSTIKKSNEICNIQSGFNNLLTMESTQAATLDHSITADNAKIILNLDTNTTTTMKPGSNGLEASTTSTSKITGAITKSDAKDKERTSKTSLSYSIENSFIPIGNRTETLHSDLSNDLFASLQVPSSSHNPESISPTAAFLMAFPLVSSLNGKTEVLEEDMKEDLKYHSQTPPMLLQIGTIEPNSFKVKQTADNADTKCPPEKNSKAEVCPSTVDKTTIEASSKVLPKIVNTETFRERMYKVVPFSNESKKLSESTFSCSTTSLTSSTVACGNRDKEIPTKPDTTYNVAPTKYNIIPSSSSSLLATTINELPKYNTNIRYPSIPEYLPSYSTFTASTSDNQILPLNNSIVSSYSTSQIPASQSYPVYSMAKDVVQTSQHTNFSNPLATASPKQINSIDNQHTIMSAERPEYQTRTLNGPLSTTSLSSSQSLQYNNSSRPKDLYSIPIPQNSQSIYSSHENKNDSSCTTLSSRNVSTVSTSGTYTIHSKDSVNQIPHQAFSIGQRHKSVTATSSSSYITSRNIDTLPIHLDDKNIPLNSYQSYIQIGQSKNSSSTTGQQQQRTNDVQLQSLGQSLPTQVKQIPPINSFDNIQQQNNYTTPTKHHDTFAPTNSTEQRIKSLPEGVTKAQNPLDNSSQQQVDTLFHTKRNDTQTYSPYSREQKKLFDANPLNNSQITKSHVQSTALTRYQIQHQQQQNCAATSNYSQSTAKENIAKTSTTTVANSSSNFSILSWTTFSPICGGSNNNNNTNNSNNNSNNNNDNINNNRNNDNNSDNSIVQFEPVTQHRSDTQGNKICDNFNYTTLHKENIGYGNLLASEASFTADTAIISDETVEKTKNKLNIHKEQTTFDDATSNKTKNSVQSSIVPQQQQQQQQKSARTLNQNQNLNDNFKFNNNENNQKNKTKFPIDSAYTQNEFATLDEQQRHQHTTKTHQVVSSKPEKTATYSIPGFDSQVSFEITDTVPPTKCSADIYSGRNYKYPGNKAQHSQNKYQAMVQSQPIIIQQDNPSYNATKQNQPQQQNINSNNSNSKPKPITQQQSMRPPVNWMMTPEIKHNANVSDIILPPIGKELEFCPNNIFGQTPSYNQTSSNQFYNNYDATVSSAHTFPNVSTVQTDSRRIIDSFYTDDQQFSWSPTKNPQSTETMKTIEQQVVVPSTLPTLVGDLALGTNIPEKQNFLYSQMPPRSSNDLAKPTAKEKEAHVGVRDFQVILNPQTVQQTSQSGSFLSVSQLVENEKEKTHHQQQSHHPHHHSQQQSQAPLTQTRKPQRKAGNTSPRGGTKRPIEIRKETSDQQLQQQQQQQTQPQVQQQHADEQKVSSAHVFSDQTYQQQQQQQQQLQQPIKYQQNDALWRNRNCKSNYTAEALIGVNNTSIHDANNADKQLHTPALKFSTDYTQNKFPTSLSATDMVMPTINYLANSDDGTSYGQMVNQNFNHTSYTYSTNSNIYPSTNFMTGISNTPSNYPMMPLHDNANDYLETNSFLLPNVGSVGSTIKTPATITSSVTTRPTTSALTAPATAKNHQQYGNNNSGKQQNCTEKRNSYASASKKSKRKLDIAMNNLDFSISGVTAPMEDYHPHAPTHPHSQPHIHSHPHPHHHNHHHPPPPPVPPPPHHHHHHHHHHHAHATSFLATPHANTLYQNPSHTSTANVGLVTNTNRTRGSVAGTNSAPMTHHPSGTSLTNFNLSAIFPEINDKVTGYKASNAIVPGLSQPSNHSTANYAQRANYTTNNTLGHVPQISESTQFTTNLPPLPASVLHYKAT